MIRIPVLPVTDLVVFPRMMVPLFLTQGAAASAVDAASAEGGRLFVVTQRPGQQGDASAETCFPVGTVCSVVRTLRLADGRLKVLVHGEARGQVARWEGGA